MQTQSDVHDSEVGLTLSEELLHDVLTPCSADLQRSCWVADIGRLYGNLCQETEISTHYHLAQTVSLQTTATLHIHGNVYTYTMCTSINDIIILLSID